MPSLLTIMFYFTLIIYLLIFFRHNYSDVASTSRSGHITLQHNDNTFNEWVDMSKNFRVATQNLEIRVDVIEGKIICKLLISTKKK